MLKFRLYEPNDDFHIGFSIICHEILRIDNSLDTSKIPEGLNGFYLSNWNQFGYYTCIVNEKLKEALLQLAELPKFLDFAEL